MFNTTQSRHNFHLPAGMIYLNSHSLGPLPRAVAARAQQVITDEWGDLLITAWNYAGWRGQPARVGDRIARLISAAPDTVMVGDTL